MPDRIGVLPAGFSPAGSVRLKTGIDVIENLGAPLCLCAGGRGVAADHRTAWRRRCCRGRHDRNRLRAGGRLPLRPGKRCANPL